MCSLAADLTTQQQSYHSKGCDRKNHGGDLSDLDPICVKTPAPFRVII